MVALLPLRKAYKMSKQQDPNKPMTLTQAAAFAKVSPQTIRRRKDLLTNVGAITSPQGWQVTIKHLAAIGLLDNVNPGTPKVTPMEAPQSTDTEVRLLHEHVETLKAQLKREQERADNAEQRANQAEERLHRLLEPPPEAKPEQEHNNKPSWFTRLFNKP
uniref:Uncharacterized protein n=1 Tax=Pygoscelis antarcticus TaxID=79643 RepID=A0A7G7LKJ6_PYGAN|nr:hypothetical protein [Pygoscelis antarcticus]